MTISVCLNEPCRTASKALTLQTRVCAWRIDYAQTFKGKTFVDIREYYTDKASGQEKPGKKGISLQMDDWNTLKGLTEEVRRSSKTRLPTTTG